MQVDESGNMIIARILGGSTAARQELLRTGEVILEVNGKKVRNPEELQQAIQDAKENLSLKLAPGIAQDGNRPLKSTVSAILFRLDVSVNRLRLRMIPHQFSWRSFERGEGLGVVNIDSNENYNNDFITNANCVWFVLAVLHAGSLRLRSIRGHAATLSRDRTALPEGRHSPNRRSSRPELVASAPSGR